MRHFLPALALLASCGPPPSETATPASTDPPPPATATTWQVDYAFTYESSCSQSWDTTTWRGTITLYLASNGTASLDVTSSSHSINPDGSFVDPEEACAWNGTYETGRDKTVIELQPMHAEEIVFECDVESWPQDEPRALDPVTLTCMEAEQGGFQVLACSSEKMLPRVLRDLLFKNTLYLAAEPGVTISASDGDHVMGPTWSLGSTASNP